MCFSGCCAGTLCWRVGSACGLCINTSQKLVWTQRSPLYADATPLALGRGKEGNTHGQVPSGEKLEEEEGEGHLRHQHLRVHYNTGFGGTMGFSTRQLLRSACVNQN